MLRQSRFDLAVFLALAGVMLLTRTHSLSQAIHLPDTSWASFFVAGYYIRSRLAFPALFLLGFAIDVVMIRLFGTSDFCFTSAYWLLVPAYGAMWLAGGWARKRYEASVAALPMVLALVCSASFVAELISSAGFYFTGGRFADPTLMGFIPRFQTYFPYTLGATLGWVSVAALAHGLALALRLDLPAGKAR